MPIVVIEVFEDNEIVTNIFFNTFLIVWVTSIGHAFISRYEYLVRREALIVNQAAAIAAYRQKVQAEYLQQGNLQQPIYQPPEQFYANSAQQQQPLPQQADSGNLSPLVCPPPSSQPKSQQMPGQQTSQPGHKIDLNTATEQQLSSLPGVSIALAKKALGLRTQSGGFFSTKDFCERLELMPHFAVQIEKLAFVGKAHVKTPQNENNSRVIDI